MWLAGPGCWVWGSKVYKSEWYAEPNCVIFDVRQQHLEWLKFSFGSYFSIEKHGYPERQLKLVELDNLPGVYHAYLVRPHPAARQASCCYA